jgi:hypothetical protein
MEAYNGRIWPGEQKVKKQNEISPFTLKSVIVTMQFLFVIGK